MKRNLIKNILAIIAVLLALTVSAKNEGEDTRDTLTAGQEAVIKEQDEVDVTATNPTGTVTDAINAGANDPDPGNQVVETEQSCMKLPLWLLITIASAGGCIIAVVVIVIIRKHKRNKKKKDMNTSIETPDGYQSMGVSQGGVPNGNKLKNPAPETTNAGANDNEEINRLKIELGKAQNMAHNKELDLQAVTKECQAKLQEMQNKLNEYESKMKDSQSMAQDVQTKMQAQAQALQNKEKELLAKEKDLQNKTQEVQARLQEMQNKMQEMQSKMQAQSQVLQNKDSELHAKVQAMQMMEHDMRVATDALRVKDEALKVKDNALQAKIAEIGALTEKITTKDAELMKCAGELTSLRSQIVNRDAMIERLHNDVLAEQRNTEEKLSNARKEYDIRIEDAKAKAWAAVETWRTDRDAVMGKITGLGDRLVEQLSKLSPNAFNGNCGTIVNGAKNFVAVLKEKMSSEQWHDKKTSECLAELRAMGVSLIEAGTNSWINLLGRLYSYMSVPELEMRLSEEGVDFDKVTEIYLTVGAIFASFGMVIYNCSPGFDSANDKATNYMFQHKSSIDRITRWLDGEEAVKAAVPNHGHTVYDFGQLAYITVDDTNIHQGCVMFYNE